MTGHKTRPVFERYNIVCEADLFDAATKRLNAKRDMSPTTCVPKIAVPPERIGGVT